MADFKVVSFFLSVMMIMVAGFIGKHNRILARVASVFLIYAMIAFSFVDQRYSDTSTWITTSASIALVAGIVMAMVWMILDVAPVNRGWLAELRRNSTK